MPTSGILVIESTAEGREGDFFKMVQVAEANHASRHKLTPRDYRMHFYAWWQEPKYRLEFVDTIGRFFDAIQVGQVYGGQRYRWRIGPAPGHVYLFSIDVAGQEAYLADFIAPLREAGCRVSMFIGHEPAQIEASARIGAAVVELHTGAYCDLDTEGRIAERDAELAALQKGAAFAASLGLEVHAGHGLTFDTVGPIAAIPQVMELNIGHFLIAESVFIGLDGAIREMRRRMDAARAGSSS